jgi:soluble lytic murein transglycosylase-like protein
MKKPPRSTHQATSVISATLKRRELNKGLLIAGATALTYSLSPFAINNPSKGATISPPSDDFRTLLQQTIQEANSFKDRFEAEVWLVDMAHRLRKYVKKEDERLTILKAVHREASRNQLNIQIVLSVIHVESLFDRFAISSVGAQGLMQIMPFWKKELNGSEDNLMAIDTNIRYGCTILKTYLKMEKGSYRHALARYNGSTGKNWYPERVFNAWQRYWYVKG